MTNFGIQPGLGRKRKKPERDMIDEMLAEEENEDLSNQKRAKTEEGSDRLIENTKRREMKEQNSGKEKVQNTEISRKTGKLIVKVYEVLDKNSFDHFRKVMKKVNKKVYTHADSIINDILIAFFNSSIGVADLNSEISPVEVPLYLDRKDLSTQLAMYMPRDIRPKYKEMLSNFYTKYESHHKNARSAVKRQAKTKPKEIKNKIDEIAKRRADIKKMKKKEEIDKMMMRKIAENTEDSKGDEPEPENDTF
eukprot:CAMPEP_0196996062 /NCGR_PEP_ID=MMETSP1380-20130617/2039_1 /TAXON_ID=5936 /ORGANISM="Euplotes crassus, Strain CT5" /LENGTH=249 /DNA_ID=CAMNT_0042411917 /DNA_START=29 /DNA_END=778 /DNA_ORIENTATION=+